MAVLVDIGKGFWGTLATTSKSGITRTSVLKATIRSGEEVDGGGPSTFWELRRLLPLLDMDGADVYKSISHGLSRNWAPAMRRVALDLTDHYRPSHKSGRMTGADINKCSPESEVSTEMMLVIALAQMYNTHEKKREAGNAFLSSFLTFVVPNPKAMQDIRPQDPSIKILNLCIFFHNAAGNCAHTVSVLNAITADAIPYVKFHELLIVLYLHVSNCLTCKLWAHDALLASGRYAEIATNLEHLDSTMTMSGKATR